MHGNIEDLGNNFHSEFAASIGLAAGIDPSRVIIMSVTAGSLVVTFAVVDGTSPSEPTFEDALSKLDMLAGQNLLSVWMPTLIPDSYNENPFEIVAAEPEAEEEPEPFNYLMVEPESDKILASEPEPLFIWGPTVMMYILLLGLVIAYYMRGIRIRNVGNTGIKAAVDSGDFLIQKATALMHLSDDGQEQLPIRLHIALERHYTTWKPIFKIILPGMFCAIVAPMMMTYRASLLMRVFPDARGDGTDLNLNEAISCFLAPAGMVYAIFFGFCYSGVSERIKMINALIAAETGSINLVLRIVYSMSDALIPPTSKLLIAMVCRETVTEMLEDVCK